MIDIKAFITGTLLGLSLGVALTYGLLKHSTRAMENMQFEAEPNWLKKYREIKNVEQN